MKYLMRSLTVLMIAAALTGCATTNPDDPFEGYNRAMFEFNDKLDQAVLKPTAVAYRDTAPDAVQIAVGNFFENLSDVWTGANNLLQGKVEDGMNDLMRFSVNSTFGILGLIDIASPAGIPKHKQDFGTTLGVWGIPSGPFVMLPLMGPSTVRDTAALPVDFQADPWSYVDPARTRYAGSALRLVDKRAAALDAFNLIEEAALDRYEFIRDAFMQRRENKVNQSKERGGGAALDDQSELQPGDGADKLSYIDAESTQERSTLSGVPPESNKSSHSDASFIASVETPDPERAASFSSVVRLNEETANFPSETIAN
ncbi:MAG: MlaA family lipoprotein [Burkholderiaceae bacterium]